MKKSEQVRIAGILWERMVLAFNEEAKTYIPEAYNSPLGSIGEVSCREVCRSDWWRALGGEQLIGSQCEDRGIFKLGKKNDDGFKDYWVITHLIEDEHHGEHLETGIIRFGS
jgi:hypothetical protein